MLANEVELPADLRNHPQVLTVDANGLSVMELDKLFTTNSRGLLTAGRLRQELYTKLKDTLSRKNHPWLFRSNGTALEVELRKVLKTGAPPEPARRVLTMPPAAPPADAGEPGDRTQTPKGYWNTLIEKHGGIDVTKSNAEEGRRLADLAKADGYATTAGAAAQAVLQWKKKHQLGDRPRSVTTPRLQVLKLLDDTFAGFQLVRDYVEKVEAENLELRRKLEKAKKVAATMMSDD